MLALLLQRLSELSVSPDTPATQRGEPVNLVQWFQWYAFEVIGELSFSRRLGFLDSKSDVGGTCELLDQFIAYTSAVAMVPKMHKYLLGNPYLKYIASPPASIIADIAAAEIANRDEHPKLVYNDLVEKIMSSQKEKASDVSTRRDPEACICKRLCGLGNNRHNTRCTSLLSSQKPILLSKTPGRNRRCGCGGKTIRATEIQGDEL